MFYNLTIITMIIKCKNCWKEFSIPKSREWHVKYCSKECRCPNLRWKKSGRLTALWEQKHINWVLYEKCICECWKEIRTQRRYILNWTTKSCGCYKTDKLKEYSGKPKTHWWTHTRLYKIYRWMVERCNWEWNDAYKKYWWRWIKCLRNSFEEFRDDMWENYNKHIELYWEKDTTLDRIDVNWNYCKSNCRWATRLEQANNKRDNLYYEYRNEKMSLSDLCRKYNVEYARTKERLKKWWSIEDAIELPKVPWYIHSKWKDFIIKFLRKRWKN